MIAHVHRHNLIEVWRLGDRVGQEKLPVLPEEKVFERFRFGRSRVKLLRMDYLLDHHDDILQAVDYLVTGSLQVTAKHLGLKGTQRRTF